MVATIATIILPHRRHTRRRTMFRRIKLYATFIATMVIALVGCGSPDEVVGQLESKPFDEGSLSKEDKPIDDIETLLAGCPVNASDAGLGSGYLYATGWLVCPSGSG